MNASLTTAKPVAFTAAVLLFVLLSPSTLRSQPMIVVQPQSRAVPEGEDVLFTVSASGAAPLSFQWRFNATNVLGATSSNLYLTSVHSNQAGNYSVRVSNVAGATLSSNAPLTLLPPPVCVAAPSGIVSWWPGDGSPKDVIGTNDATPLLFPPFPPFGVSNYAAGKVGLGLDQGAANELRFRQHADEPDHR